MNLSIYNTTGVEVAANTANDTHWITLEIDEQGVGLEVTLYFNSRSEMDTAIEAFKRMHTE